MRQRRDLRGGWLKPVLTGQLPGRWIALCGVLIAILLAVPVLAGLRGSSEPAASGGAASSGEATFLAEGYAQLEQSGYRFSSAPSAWDVIGSMAIPLMVVIVGAYGTIRGLRYLNRRMAQAAGRSEFLEVIETLPLGGAGVLHVVRIGNRVVVIGAGGTGLSLITELGAEEAQALLARRAGQAGGMSSMTAMLPRFRDVLATRLPHAWSIVDTTVRGDAGAGLERQGNAPPRPPVGANGARWLDDETEASRRFGYRPDARDG